MSRPSSPEIDPFETPDSTRPPSILLQESANESAAYASSSDSGAGRNSRPVLSRPSTGTSFTSGDTTGIIMIPRTTPTTNQPRIRSMLNSRPNSSRSVANQFFTMPTSPLQASHTTPKKPKGQLPRMPSHLINPDEPVPKPWKEKKSPRATFAYWLTYFVVFIGFAAGLVQSYFNYAHAELDRQPLCLVFEENFDSEDAVFGSNGTFEREVSMDGSGNGEFEMYTASTNNSYVKDGFLYIVPTLTADEIGWDAVFNNTVYNITGCTFNETQTTLTSSNTKFNEKAYLNACSAVSNLTALTVINPVQSARITTRKTASIRYGRVEIRAKMPNGDWLWPALWMLPRDSVYGEWPRSGEIDLVEARGNGIRYTARGSNYVQGSLNWGPMPELNSVSKTYSWWSDRRSSFGSDFHTYALEWTEKFMRIYVDSRLHTLLDLSFDQSFFQRGDYPGVIINGSNIEPLQNPWSNGTKSTPFDQEFYLLLNVAVGGTTGWFPDWQGNKPWLNNGVSPMYDFANASTQWYPTWSKDPAQRGMVVDYVKMWKHCNGN
ncbi:ectomycorrhiza-upregulated GH16 glucan endo-1,3-beta-glucosidase precursor [Amanita muscaria]